MGGEKWREGLMKLFRQAIVDCHLAKVWHKGDLFTWSNLHADNTFTKEQLDRALINKFWKVVYNDAHTECLVVKNSNHKSLFALCAKN